MRRKGSGESALRRCSGLGSHLGDLFFTSDTGIFLVQISKRIEWFIPSSFQSRKNARSGESSNRRRASVCQPRVVDGPLTLNYRFFAFANWLSWYSKRQDGPNKELMTEAKRRTHIEFAGPYVNRSYILAVVGEAARFVLTWRTIDVRARVQ